MLCNLFKELIMIMIELRLILNYMMLNHLDNLAA